MMHHDRWIIAALFVAALPSTGCRQASDAAAGEKQEKRPATVEHLEGAQPTRVTLTEDAARRLDIQTTAIRDTDVGGTQRKVMPYAAILYDTQGDTWTYINPKPLIFVRHHISVDRIEGEQVVLLEGPPTDTKVVTVGAAELYGSEIEFEEE